MILLIDIGNSHLVFGLSKTGKNIDSIKRMPLAEIQGVDDIKNNFLYSEIKKIIFSSVVPRMNDLIISCANSLSVDYVHIKNYQDFSFKVDLENPETVGIDRLLSLYAICDDISSDIMVIDAGTATTYNILSKEKVFLGGSIGAGFHMLRTALHEKTAVLPLVDLNLTIDSEIDLLGKNSIDAMKSGIFWGYVSQMNGMISLYKNRFSDLYIVGTGGVMPYVQKHIRLLDKYDDNLLLKGLLKFQ